MYTGILIFYHLSDFYEPLQKKNLPHITSLQKMFVIVTSKSICIEDIPPEDLL